MYLTGSDLYENLFYHVLCAVIVILTALHRYGNFYVALPNPQLANALRVDLPSCFSESRVPKLSKDAFGNYFVLGS